MSKQFANVLFEIFKFEIWKTLLQWIWEKAHHLSGDFSIQIQGRSAFGQQIKEMCNKSWKWQVETTLLFFVLNSFNCKIHTKTEILRVYCCLLWVWNLFLPNSTKKTVDTTEKQTEKKKYCYDTGKWQNAKQRKLVNFKS